MDFNDGFLNIKQGKCTFEGICDYTKTSEYEWEYDCLGYILRLNGQNYAIWEDPDDGYRSYCDINRTDLLCTNTFPPQEVFLISTKDFMYIYNIDNGSLILKVGTDYNDAYYPYAVMEFHPENMPINII